MMDKNQATKGKSAPSGTDLTTAGNGATAGPANGQERDAAGHSAFLRINQVAPERSRTETLPEDAGAMINAGKPRILYVDDDVVQVKLVVRMLERLGYQIVGTNSCSEALVMVRDNPAWFDLIISDLTMPNMCGRELCGQIRKIRADISIILCTGYGMLNDRYFEDGLYVDAYLSKPFTMRRINDLIRTVMKKNQTFPTKV